MNKPEFEVHQEVFSRRKDHDVINKRTITGISYIDSLTGYTYDLGNYLMDEECIGETPEALKIKLLKIEKDRFDRRVANINDLKLEEYHG